ncbi:MAG: hypothetical protein HZA50_06255 [Planctomycetes bacterium]|nr:hypothetical protein [Planctomycetota bacterium]
MTASRRTAAILIAGLACSFPLAGSAQQAPTGLSAASHARPDSPAPGGPDVSQTIRSLIRDNNTPLGGGKASDDLQKSIEKIRALIPSATAPAAARNEFPILPAVKVKPTTQPRETATQPGRQPELKLSDKDLDMIRQLPPEIFKSPLALADRLFSEGRRDLAAIFYDQAARQIRAADKDWAIYQLGNCLRDADPVGARKAYKRVSDEHPDSPWKPMADRQVEMIDWDQTNKPRQMLEKASEARAAVNE